MTDEFPSDWEVPQPVSRLWLTLGLGVLGAGLFPTHYEFAPDAFAVIKAAFDLRRFLLRGIEEVRQEWLWACTAFNLNKLMRLWAELRDKLRVGTIVMVN